MGQSITRVAALLLAVASSLAFAEKSYRISLNGENTAIEFTAIGKPEMMKIRGHTDEKTKEPVKGSFAIDGRAMTGDVKYQMKALTTGIGLRDKHMHEKYLQSEKFPEAVLKLDKFSLPQAFIDGDFDAKKETFSGKLTMREVTKDIKGDVDIRRNGDGLEMVFQFKILISDFKIPSPGFMAVTMANEVTISAAVKGKLDAMAKSE